MKTISLIIFDHFTDIDLFLMWDLLGREKSAWNVKILGSRKKHISANGLSIETHGLLSEANSSDVVLFCSGSGSRKIIKDKSFLQAFNLDPNKQLIGSICSGALILASLGILNGIPATTHPRAKSELQALGIHVIDFPLVSSKNIATAGGCLSALYLMAWLIEKIHSREKWQSIISQVYPIGQTELYEKLVIDT